MWCKGNGTKGVRVRDRPAYTLLETCGDACPREIESEVQNPAYDAVDDFNTAFTLCT